MTRQVGKGRVSLHIFIENLFSGGLLSSQDGNKHFKINQLSPSITGMQRPTLLSGVSLFLSAFTLFCLGWSNLYHIHAAQISNTEPQGNSALGYLVKKPRFGYRMNEYPTLRPNKV